MKFACISKIFRIFAIVFIFAGVSAHGQIYNDALINQVRQLIAKDDYTSIAKLVDAQETLWKSAPSTSYFRDMATIAFVLMGQSNDRMYWLGRKVIWDVLFKPAPREEFAAQKVYSWKRDLLTVGTESINPYVFNASPEMYASIRHDTFLMLSEYARQLHAEIIPGYRNKWPGAMEEDRRPFIQNAIDNEVQRQNRAAIRWLSEDTEQSDYLVRFYRRKPRNDQELKQLLDVLNIQGAPRDMIIKQVNQEMVFPPGFPPELRKKYEW